MKMSSTSAAATLLLIALGAGCGAPQGDAARGEQLHRACLGCHGSELYGPPNAKITSLRDLRKSVEEWNDRMNPKLTEQEISDVVAYLDRDFYRFPK